MSLLYLGRVSMEHAARTSVPFICVTVKMIRDEAKKTFSLAETAKAMGVSASFVVTFDTPLMKPVASSTSAASLYAAIQEHEVFTSAATAEEYLIKAHDFFRNAKYNIAAHMKPIATRRSLGARASRAEARHLLRQRLGADVSTNLVAPSPQLLLTSHSI